MPTIQEYALANKAIGATNALNELRERLYQAGLDADYMQVVDAFRTEKYEEEQKAKEPIWEYMSCALPAFTDEPVAPYSVAFVAEAAA